ncbi:MAG TPA: SusD/RagB family nutrient-binding outer membrane lipoprotein, partial [Bacteroidales bacterium]|nr:SusD/RagB family nutrient-binding outer membrane lipoprotein [Bacteroidales bacterium]
MKKVIYSIIAVFMLVACTNEFEDANINPYEISEESLTQDFNHIGSFFPSMLSNIFGHQIEENLIAESYCDYMATPTPFVSGKNNTTYYITWNTYWDRMYNSIMSPATQVIYKADQGGFEVFARWAKLIQILG